MLYGPFGDTAVRGSLRPLYVSLYLCSSKQTQEILGSPPVIFVESLLWSATGVQIYLGKVTQNLVVGHVSEEECSLLSVEVDLGPESGLASCLSLIVCPLESLLGDSMSPLLN